MGSSAEPGAARSAAASSPFSFRVESRAGSSAARAGLLSTPHGDVATPAFVPVGTRGTVKGVRPEELRALGTEVVLANTYHLHVRPGEETVRALGGLHRFMGWDGPILTDSGGYQVTSLSHLVRIDEEGATFRSVVDGAAVRFTPERVLDVQRALGSDLVMPLDHCPKGALDRGPVADAAERTARWLERSVSRWREAGAEESGQALFGIVQGGAFPDLRAESVERTLVHELPGHAIGGVGLGEPPEARRAAVESATELLPADRPRYLMGIGTPLDCVDAVLAGVDLFDCVTPTRHGRNHQAFTSEGRLNVRNLRYARDDGPLDPACDCPTCTRFPRGYLRHLALAGEMLAGILLTLHNLRAFHRLMRDLRESVAGDRIAAVRARAERMDARA